MEAAVRFATRAAGSSLRRFSTASTGFTTRVTAAVTAARKIVLPSDVLPEVSRVSDPAFSLGMEHLTAQIQGSSRLNQSAPSAGFHVPSYKFHQANPTYSKFPLVDDAFASNSACSMWGRRSFCSLPSGAPPQIIEYKQKVIDPTFYEPKFFAQNVMNPMLKFPNKEFRLLADDMGSFYTPSEDGKPLFYSFRQILFDLHRNGKAIAKHISMDDFWITESYHEYRFVGDTVIQVPLYKFVIKDGTPISRFRNRLVKDNYCDGSDALQEFICYTCDLDEAPLAVDLKDSLADMKVTNFPKGYLPFVDPVFLPLEARSEAFLDVYDELSSGRRRMDNYTRPARDDILKGIIWEEIAGAHDLLRKWYEFKEDGYYNKGSWSLMSYLRHVNRHPLQYFHTRYGEYTKAELQRLLQVKFPKVMSKLYRNLFKLGVLKVLGAHRFFRLH